MRHQHAGDLTRWDPFRWDPFKEVEHLGEQFNRMLARWPGRDHGREFFSLAEWSPAVDISETDAEYLIKAEIPEVDRKDVKVAVQDGVLSIQGERRQEKEEKGKRFHRIERSYGSFARSFTLPEEVDETKLKAEFKEGILLLHLPKSEKHKENAHEVVVE
jgi:HSP20 family protein